ncbi:MAG TPA: hypothetical protein VHZ53_04330 [Steroidobacteraceae bacterium]|jgi:hypothetical protein|nr:hypothetical protein [Steroidobacteraceae bacterium]
MIDAEVMRLRNLRSAALDARAVAAVIDTQKGRRQTVFARGALCCWQIARLATGALRAHPYLPYQRDVGASEAAMIRLTAQLTGRGARQRGTGMQRFARSLDAVTRQLADARSLTWHQDLGAAFGRRQAELAQIVAEVAAAARREAEAHGRKIPAFLQPRTGAPAASREQALEGNWPYLAF